MNTELQRNAQSLVSHTRNIKKKKKKKLPWLETLKSFKVLMKWNYVLDSVSSDKLLFQIAC